MATIPKNQVYSGNLSYVNPAQKWDGSKPVTIDLRESVIEFPTGIFIPAGSVPTALALHVPNTIDADTATNIGIGTTSSPEKYGSFALTAGDYEQPLDFWGSPLSADENIVVSATDGAGNQAGTIGGGGDDYVVVRMGWYQVLPIFNS